MEPKSICWSLNLNGYLLAAHRKPIPNAPNCWSRVNRREGSDAPPALNKNKHLDLGGILKWGSGLFWLVFLPPASRLQRDFCFVDPVINLWEKEKLYFCKLFWNFGSGLKLWTEFCTHWHLKNNGNVLSSLSCQSEPVCTPGCNLCFHFIFAMYIHVFTGERRTVVSCMRIANKTMEVVNNSHCHPENQPHPQVRLCNTHPCQYRWDPDVWHYFSSVISPRKAIILCRVIIKD